ncbi:hypothetical protein HPB51_016700 [Rhipicephalus microplus]|uniref:Uncharacterized protein n=1 Tax=Rhipicephalus microplus TaxID=6941 RepID=A0A9J6D5V0_RHIMP|nr:hypothetical protein HPB51_016700 [Rhipicephalus microplus]
MHVPNGRRKSKGDDMYHLLGAVLRGCGESSDGNFHYDLFPIRYQQLHINDFNDQTDAYAALSSLKNILVTGCIHSSTIGNVESVIGSIGRKRSRARRRQEETTAVNAAYKKLGHKIAERSVASYLPQLSANDYKIIIRPKCGLALTRVPNTMLSEVVRMAVQISWIKGQEKEVLVVNDKQGTLIFSTPDIETVWKVTRIKSIKIEGKNYDVTAYLAPHEDSGRGVVRGIDTRLSVEELTETFGNSRNPPILGVRKLGNSSSAVIIFKNETVPRCMYCYGVPLKCVLYKKRYEVCYRCG